MNTTGEDGSEPELVYAYGYEPELAYASVFGCILVVGLPLNAVSLWILCRHHSLDSPSAIYMINLAFSDLLLVISLPLRVYFYATGTWPLNDWECNLCIMLFRSNIRSSAFFITAISVDRLLAVVYPLRSRHLRTSFNASKVAALIWLFVLVLNIPDSLAFLSYSAEKNNTTSSCFTHDASSKTAMFSIQPLLIFIMLAVNIVCTVRVSWTLKKHLNGAARVNKKVNVMLIFVMNLIVFTVCFIPLYTVLLTVGDKTQLTPFICLASVNCCLDPVLYYFSLDSFWKKKENVDVPTGQ